jgi:hypothetical protein
MISTTERGEEKMGGGMLGHAYGLPRCNVVFDQIIGLVSSRCKNYHYIMWTGDKQQPLCGESICSIIHRRVFVVGV